MPRSWRSGALVVWFLLAPLVGKAVAADLKNFEDANLHAVEFLDEHEGWAVGDEGTIWHTMDGGELWERQSSGTRATLTALDIRDFRLGWIGGRESLPYSPGSTGLLLWTRDGGGKWILASRQLLPGVTKVHFDDADRGWVLGETSDQNPSGLFFTTNGARSWDAIKGQRFPGWQAAHFLDFGSAILGGRERSFVSLRQGVVLPANCDWLPGSTVRDITGSGQNLWAVGDQGQVFTSPDHGRTWSRPDVRIPHEARVVWNFNAVTAVGSKVWAIGRPGSVVLHSADAGKTWTVQKTGQALPMYDIHFPDENHGWAVGAMGTILATQDGGATWKTQRQGGGQAAILWLNQVSQNIPLTVVARYGGDEGYHNVAFGLTSFDAQNDLPNQASRHTRFFDAFRAVGGSTAETSSRFPLAATAANDPVETQIARWNKLHEGKATLEIERELALAIRIWKPAVVVTDWIEPTASNTMASALTGLGVRRATQAADEPEAFSEQMSFFGLSPHAPAKVYARNDESETPSVSLDAGGIGPRLGESFADAADTGMAIDREEFAPTERSAKFVVLDSTLKDAQAHKSLMTGVAIGAGTAARRPQNIDAVVDQDAVKRAERKRNLLAIVDNAPANTAPEQFLAGLKGATAELNMLQAGHVVFQIGRRYSESGQWDYAKNSFEYLIQAYPQHPLALAAHRWLIAYQTSTEARLRSTHLAMVATETARFQKPEVDAPGITNKVGVNQVLDEVNQAKSWNGMGVLYGNRLRTASGVLWSDPGIQLCLAAAHRRLGNLDAATLSYNSIVEEDAKSRWATIIEQEKWNYDRKTPAPRPVALSLSVPKKPYLDGKLNEECWKGKDLGLTSSGESLDKEFATRVALRHDKEFLYLSASCAYPDASFKLAPAERAGHDADISGADHIDILIDLDRDYSTYYRLQVDQRGLVAADCWGDITWNPRWFVATESDETGWRLEAAIPLSELTDAKSLTGEIWAFNVMRVIPGKGVLAWTLPASTEIRPDGFSLLQFIKHDARPSESSIKTN